MSNSSSTEFVEVKGRFKKTIWSNAEQFRISLFSFESAGDAVPSHVENDREFVAKGSFIPENDSLITVFTGRWEKNKGRDGFSFKVKTFDQEAPASKDGIIKFLASGLYKGIGTKTAENIFNTFGKESIEVVTRQTDRLREIRGIGPSTVASIIESVKETVELQDLVRFLSQYDIGLNKIKRIQKAFPVDTLEIIQREPFKLCEIHGFGFLTVDGIAAKLGTPLGSPYRIRAAVDTVLKANNNDGHLFMVEEAMLEKALELLNKRALPGEGVSEETIRTELQIMEFDEKIVFERNCDGTNNVYLEVDYKNENTAALRLVSLLNAPLDKRRDFAPGVLDNEIALAEKEFGITLAPKQVSAVKMALTSKVCVITGGPGTGKTTILRFLLRLYKKNVSENYKEDAPGVLLLSPTGKAARRMSESANEPAFTIHKGLGITPGDDGCGGNSDDSESYLTDDIGYVFLDEGSMTDMSIMAKLVCQIPLHSQFVCIGDIDQLPSVGAGAVLKDMIESSIIPVVRLDVIYRQGETSLIIQNAHKIRTGDGKLSTAKSQFAFFPTAFTKMPGIKNPPQNILIDPKGDEIAQDLMIDYYLRAVNKYGLRETQILCPRREDVVASAMEVNRRIQARLFDNRIDVPKFTVGGKSFYLGERIIQTKNKEKANNGDMGIIRSIRKDPEQANSFIVGIEFDFMDEGMTVDYYMDDFDNIQLGYAITIHKSQGSEFKAVFIPVLWSQVHMMKRNLLYTGVTRGKEIVCLFGQSMAVQSAIHREDTNRRNTMFMQRLKECYHGQGDAA